MPRTSREQETRAATPAHPEEYTFGDNDYFTQASLLKLPDPPPDKVYRWIRVGRDGATPDVKNVQRRTTLEHWTPIDPSVLVQTEGNFIDMRSAMQVRDPKDRSKYKTIDVIQVDDLVAMERPKTLQDRAREANRQQVIRQQQAITANLHNASRGLSQHGKVFDPEYRTKESRGQPPDVAGTGSTEIHSEDVL